MAKPAANTAIAAAAQAADVTISAAMARLNISAGPPAAGRSPGQAQALCPPPPEDVRATPASGSDAPHPDRPRTRTAPPRTPLPRARAPLRRFLRRAGYSCPWALLLVVLI